VEDTDIQFLKTAVTRSELLNFFEANIRANAERLLGCAPEAGQD
jgi:hypothetical protein